MLYLYNKAVPKYYLTSRPPTAMALPNNGAPLVSSTPQQEAFDVGQMRSFLMQAPAAIALLEGPAQVYSFANPLYQQLFGRTNAALLGKPLRQVFPELKDQGVFELFDEVYRNAQPFTANEFKAVFTNEGKTKTGYYNFTIQPIKNEGGEVTTLMVHAYEVTAAVQERTKKEESEQRFAAAIQAIQGILWTNNAKGEMEGEQPAWSRLTGQRFDEYQGYGWASAVHPDDAQPTIDAWNEAVRERKTFVFEHRVKKSDGAWGYFSVRAIPLLNSGGDIREWVGVHTDITGQKQTAAQLEKSESYFRELTDTVPAIIWITRPDGFCTYLNKHWYDYTGQTAEEAEGFGWLNATHPDDKEEAGRLFIEATSGQKPYYMLYRLKHKSGEYRWAIDSGSPKYNSDGVFDGMIGTVVDVHEQKGAEGRIKESEEQFRQFSNNIQNLAWIADGEGWIHWYNQRWYDYTGTTLEEMQGWGWEKVHHPDHINRVVAFVTEAWKKPESFELTFPLRGADGVYRWFLTRAVPIINGEGKIIRWIGTNTDIDEQVVARKKVEASEARFRTLIEEAPVATCLFTGRELKIEIANEKIIAIMGKGPSVVGKPLAQAVPELAGQPFLQQLEEVFTTGQHFESRNARADLVVDGVPKIFYFDYIFKPLKNAEGEIYAILDMTIDVTDHVLARKELQESESRFRTLAEAIPQMVWVCDGKGRVEFFSQNWYNYTGSTPDQSLGHGWSSLVHPNDVAPTLANWNEAQANKAPVSVEYRLRNATGGYRWVLSKGNPVVDANGSIVRWFGACTDINEQKEFEKELEKQVAERTQELARSNEDLQQFAHVASHDLKEPVRKVRIFSAMLEEELTHTELGKAKKYIKKVQQGADRMLDMIEGVLNYSQTGVAQQLNDAVDLNKVIKDITTDFDLLLQQKDGSIIHNNLPVVKGAQVLLQQLFFNLVNNALKFSKEGVPPVITINATEGPKNGKQYVSIQVADNGIGFSPALSEKIFQTFVRLHPKDAYEGTGLGLALCKKIAERHGGTITAAGKEGEGAVFTVTLPIE